MGTNVESESGPVFLQSTEELIGLLSRETSPAASRLIEEARTLAALFRSWDVRRPRPEDRVAVIRRLVELNRIARELVSRSSSQPPPRSS